MAHLVDWWLNSRSKLCLDFLQSCVLKSRIVENAVFNHLYKTQGNDVFFFRNNCEIDFLDRSGWMVEVKYRKKVAREDFAYLSSIETGRKKVVLSMNDFIPGEDITVIPVDFYLLLRNTMFSETGNRGQ